MYLAKIGKMFLDYYNKKNNSNYSPRQFFDEEFHPLVFDHKKYLMWVQNTPFTVAANVKKHVHLKEYRDKCLETFHEKVKEGTFSMDVAIGGSASSDTETTSGQFEKIYFKNLSEDDKYLSWFGFALSIGVSGGLCIAFEDEEILYRVFEGWKVYREFLSDESYNTLGGNQLSTWNGVWILLSLKDKELAMRDANLFLNKDKSKFESRKWNELVANLYKLTKKEIVMTYIFNYGQQNTTVGLIPFKVHQLKKPIDCYIKLFGENEYLDDEEKIKTIFGSFYDTFQFVCSAGSVGIKAMRPKDIFEKNKEINPKKIDKLQLKTLKSFIMAILEKDEVINLAKQFSEQLRNYVDSDKAGKTEFENNVEKNLFICSSRLQVLKTLNSKSIMKNFDKEFSKKLSETVYSSMSEQDFSFFMELTKTNYYSL